MLQNYLSLSTVPPLAPLFSGESMGDKEVRVLEAVCTIVELSKGRVVSLTTKRVLSVLGWYTTTRNRNIVLRVLRELNSVREVRGRRLRFVASRESLLKELKEYLQR